MHLKLVISLFLKNKVLDPGGIFRLFAVGNLIGPSSHAPRERLTQKALRPHVQLHCMMEVNSELYYFCLFSLVTSSFFYSAYEVFCWGFLLNPFIYTVPALVTLLLAKHKGNSLCIKVSCAGAVLAIVVNFISFLMEPMLVIVNKFPIIMLTITALLLAASFIPQVQLFVPAVFEDFESKSSL